MCSEKKCTTDVSDNEKINQKDVSATGISDNEKINQKDVSTTDTSDNEKINKKIIDIKKDKKSSTNVDNTVKPTITSETNVTEPRKDRRIPDWLPEKDNVEILEPIDKPPHLRSKASLN